MKPTKILKIAAIPATACILAVGLASPSMASDSDGVGENNEFIFTYNSNGAGSRADYNMNLRPYGIANLAPYKFVSAGAGKGVPVKNNAAWARSRYVGYPVTATVYYNSNFSCSVACQNFQNGQSANLKTSLKNQNASVAWAMG